MTREDWEDAKFGCLYCTKHERHFLKQYACPECYKDLEELNDFQGFTPNLKVFYTVSKPTEKWDGYTGRITGYMVRELVPDNATRVPYISGPPDMVDNMVNILVNELKIPSTQIKKEHFLGY